MTHQVVRPWAPTFDRAKPLHWLVRSGFVACGLTYGIIGTLVLAVALGAGGGSATDQQGALALLAGPLGNVALVAVWTAPGLDDTS